MRIRLALQGSKLPASLERIVRMMWSILMMDFGHFGVGKGASRRRSQRMECITSSINQSWNLSHSSHFAGREKDQFLLLLYCHW